MHTFKTGDRVRCKQKGCTGTVVGVVGGAAGAAGAIGASVGDATSVVSVEWDGREGYAQAVPVEEIYAIRPPPAHASRTT